MTCGRAADGSRRGDGLNHADSGWGWDDASQCESRLREQSAQLRLGTLASAAEVHQHLQVEQLGGSAVRAIGYDVLDDQELPIVRQSRAAVSQNGERLLIAPVVDDAAENRR